MRIFSKIITFVLVFTIVCDATVTVQASTGQETQTTGEILVQFKDESTNLNRSIREQRFARKTENISQNFHLEKNKDFHNINAALFRAKSGENIDTLTANLEMNANVEFAQLNYIYQSFGQSTPWNIESNGGVEAETAWSEFDVQGAGIVVAVLDTGVDMNHEDLAENIWQNSDETCGDGVDNDDNGYTDDCYSWDFADNDADPTDEEGHGSHVAGIIAAADNSIGVVGVAPAAKIMPVRVLDANGMGTTMSIAAGINYALENGADVISLSLGSSSSDRILHAAIQKAVAAGVVIVAAAGNSGSSQQQYPAAYSNVIAVGSVNQKHVRSVFSNFGNWIDVVAPGEKIYSTTPGDNYEEYSGTSMATPHVAGIVALLLEQDSSRTPAEIQAWLQQNSQDLGAKDRDLFYGYGFANALIALGGTIDTTEIQEEPEPEEKSWKALNTCLRLPQPLRRILCTPPPATMRPR